MAVTTLIECFFVEGYIPLDTFESPLSLPRPANPSATPLRRLLDSFRSTIINSAYRAEGREQVKQPIGERRKLSGDHGDTNEDQGAAGNELEYETHPAD